MGQYSSLEIASADAPFAVRVEDSEEGAPPYQVNRKISFEGQELLVTLLDCPLAHKLL
jgi:hypothetical protein